MRACVLPLLPFFLDVLRHHTEHLRIQAVALDSLDAQMQLWIINNPGGDELCRVFFFLSISPCIDRSVNQSASRGRCLLLFLLSCYRPGKWRRRRRRRRRRSSLFSTWQSRPRTCVVAPLSNLQQVSLRLTHACSLTVRSSLFIEVRKEHECQAPELDRPASFLCR